MNQKNLDDIKSVCIGIIDLSPLHPCGPNQSYQLGLALTQMKPSPYQGQLRQLCHSYTQLVLDASGNDMSGGQLPAYVQQRVCQNNNEQ